MHTSDAQSVMEGNAGAGSATAGPNRDTCLNAFIVALNETCDGKSWYASTKELQLASMEFCIACRNVQTMHLKVDAQIPRRLLAAADTPLRRSKRLGRTLVPRLSARRVSWNMKTAAELRYPIFAIQDVDCMKFGMDFEGSVETVAWPQRLETIEFHNSSKFNQPIDLVEWPDSLQTLEFGRSFNQPIEHAKFSASLQQLIFGFSFDQPISGKLLPRSLQQLDLGARFNQPVEGVEWPPTLKQLSFGVIFNQPVERVEFPASLQEITFSRAFNQPIERAKFPASLQQLCFEWRFNQPIEDVSWPDSLQRLCFDRDFNQPVDNVRWPASLQELTFGFCFQSGHNGLEIYSDFNQHIGSSAWPASLRQLTLGHRFRQSLEGLGTWMPNLESLRLLDWNFHSQNDSLLWQIEWPKTLRQLTVFEGSRLEGVEIPSTVEVLRRHNECL
ncbi:unnamed protein product [Ectocarpus sp. 13 AM-2016]